MAVTRYMPARFGEPKATRVLSNTLGRLLSVSISFVNAVISTPMSFRKSAAPLCTSGTASAAKAGIWNAASWPSSRTASSTARIQVVFLWVVISK